MKYIGGLKDYSPIEEKINIISHAIGFILSIVALVLFVTYANLHGVVWHIVSFSIFGASLIILYAASIFYHWKGLKLLPAQVYPMDRLFARLIFMILK